VFHHKFAASNPFVAKKNEIGSSSRLEINIPFHLGVQCPNQTPDLAAENQDAKQVLQSASSPRANKAAQVRNPRKRAMVGCISEGMVGPAD